MTLPDSVETGGILLEEIQRLKKRRRAVVLAHNYQVPQIQDLAAYMKMNTVEKLRDCLAHGFPEVRIPEDIRIRALAPIAKILALS